MTMASLRAVFEKDIKKVVALSTLSQLGLIITAIGSSLLGPAFIHLLSHAFFKALLFISVGRLIHLSADYQDFRKLNHARAALPAVLSIGLLANLSLIGAPFLRGFYRKDLIIESATGASRVPSAVFLLLLSVRLTAIYTFRFLRTLLKPAASPPPTNRVLDRDRPISIAILILAIPSTVAGGGLLFASSISPAATVLPLELKLVPPVSLLLALTIAMALWATSFAPLAPGRWLLGNLWSLPFLGATSALLLILPPSAFLRRGDLCHTYRGTLAPALLFSNLGTKSPTHLLPMLSRLLPLTAFLLFILVYLRILLLTAPKNSKLFMQNTFS